MRVSVDACTHVPRADGRVLVAHATHVRSETAILHPSPVAGSSRQIRTNDFRRDDMWVGTIMK